MLSAGVNTTLINYLSGKHHPINVRGKITKCVVYIFDEHNKMLGFGASVPNAEIVVHMKYVKDSRISMVRFQYSGQSGKALVMGIHGSVALLKVSSIKKWFCCILKSRRIEFPKIHVISIKTIYLKKGFASGRHKNNFVQIIF